jgi:HEAT repeat protein
MACRALAEIGPPAKDAVPRLTRLVREGIVSSRGHAAMCLGAIGPVEGIDVVDILCQARWDENQVVRERAMIGLGRLGRQARQARRMVEEALEDPEFHPQPEAAKTLWLIAGEADVAVAKLIALSDSLTHDGRAMEVLAEMGPAAAPAASMLAARLQSDDQGVRLLAAQALGAIGPTAKPHVAALQQRLADSDPDVCQAIRTAIQQIEQPAANEEKCPSP